MQMGVRMAQAFDVVIIGGGHNGLITAGYLARAGQKVCVLEKRPVVGGACVSEEVWPGYKVSTLAYLCSLLQPRIIEELELKKFGYHIYPKDPTFFTAFPDGRHLFFHQDMRKTQEQLAKFSKKDAEYYPKYEEELVFLAEWVEKLILYETPPNIVRRRFSDLLKMGKLGVNALKLGDEGLVRMVKIMTQSVSDFLNERFESEEIKATLATDGLIGATAGPSTPGTAYILLHHVMGGATGQRGVWGFVRGGMGGITQALKASAESKGVDVRLNSGVKEILIKEGRASGVVLENGDEIKANVIVSNADPRRTFLGMISSEHLDPEFREGIEIYRSEGASVKINLALDGLPDFKALPGSELADQHKTTIHICPTVEYMEDAWDDAKNGRISEKPMLECTIPTAYDDSLAPPGKHLMNVFAQFGPYTLANGDSWDNGLKDKFADRCLDILAEYAPNIKDIVLHRQVVSPLDLEREYGMTGGNLFHGDMGLDQLFCMRPVAGWAKYRTPVRHLYMCGSGTHPGGGVMGIPGYNAAREILKDKSLGKI